MDGNFKSWGTMRPNDGATWRPNGVRPTVGRPVITTCNASIALTATTFTLFKANAKVAQRLCGGGPAGGYLFFKTLTVRSINKHICLMDLISVSMLEILVLESPIQRTSQSVERNSGSRDMINSWSLFITYFDRLPCWQIISGSRISNHRYAKLLLGWRISNCWRALYVFI